MFQVKENFTVWSRFPVNQLIEFRRVFFFKNRMTFRYVKLEITLANPASNEWRKITKQLIRTRVRKTTLNKRSYILEWLPLLNKFQNIFNVELFSWWESLNEIEDIDIYTKTNQTDNLVWVQNIMYRYRIRPHALSMIEFMNAWMNGGLIGHLCEHSIEIRACLITIIK